MSLGRAPGGVACSSKLPRGSCALVAFRVSALPVCTGWVVDELVLLVEYLVGFSGCGFLRDSLLHSSELRCCEGHRVQCAVDRHTGTPARRQRGVSNGQRVSAVCVQGYLWRMPPMNRERLPHGFDRFVSFEWCLVRGSCEL
jgi:hypothetical protein